MQTSLQCAGCKHFHSPPAKGAFTYTCAAFPGRIPDEILHARHDHRNPFPGDHGIRFEPIEAAPFVPLRPA